MNWVDFGSTIQTELEKLAGELPSGEKAARRIEAALHQAKEARKMLPTISDENLRLSALEAIEAPLRLLADLNSSLAPQVVLSCWREQIERDETRLMILAARLCMERTLTPPQWLLNASLKYCARPQLFSQAALKAADDTMEAAKTWALYRYALQMREAGEVTTARGERTEDIVGDYIGLSGRAVANRVASATKLLTSGDASEYAMLVFATVDEERNLTEFLHRRRPGMPATT